MSSTQNSNRQGFTLIELMIAIAVFAIIAIVVIPNVMSYLDRAKKGRVLSDLTTLKGAIMQYQLAVSKFPSRLQDLVRPPADPKERAKWPEGGFLEKKELPDDPWGNSYQYKLNPAGAEHPYELFSYGSDQGPDTPVE